ncbi:MAG: UPF0182 family protein [Nanoarchaeota archaeon]|nr:UPF0182 family protein [Nanoarchaeota archaeon]
MAKKNIFVGIFIALVVVAVVTFSNIARLVTDFWWFKALGFEEIFLISLKAKLALFFISAAIFLVFALINLRISGSKLKFRFKLLLALFLSLIIGLSTSARWFTVLQYFKQVGFGLQDPIFMKDVAFYTFSLPYYLMIWKFAMATVLITLILVMMDYMQSMLINLFKQPQVVTPQGPKVLFKSVFSGLKRKGIIHLGVLGSFFFILLSINHYLAKFSIMYSKQGIVVGAGYTDVMVYLPVIKFLMILAIAIAVLFYIWIFYITKHKRLLKRHILMYAIIIYFIIFFIGPNVATGLIQSLKVSPNEINLEKPYIENNIKFTRIAYGLDSVEETDFPVEMQISPEVLEGASKTIDNVRILDWRPLTQTYKQTQEIRLYYDLSGIDIDRYTIDGKYTEVMLAPREMNQRQIAENAKTWVNLHMVYTHGYGLVMSPVNKVTKEGLPDYFIKDIPPIYNVEEASLKIDRPQVYYGENENDFVLVNTDTKEFDYPKGNTNEYIQYDGKGGVVLDSFVKKLFMALRFGDIKILLSTDMTPESKIMFSRSIRNRISKLTPFFLLDNDPYLVIKNGRLVWIQDAYTTTDYFPYSEKFGRLNYMRNSVKIVVDAYDGTVDYYVVDTDDPLIVTYGKIFPMQFKSGMPEEYRDHIRYPEDLFKVQSAIYNTYHMDDPTVFYNKEDAWQIPYEIYGTGQQVPVEPYYVIIKLPGEDMEEFVLMTTFTPIKKDNMNAWMAARSDGDNYGKLLVYRFPKDKMVYGPLQIEARFDQDSEISQQLTLWSQQGSQVTRGNLLVIPIEDSLLYIEPLYIQAEQGQLPELKRVLVSDGERVVMEENLGIALEALFGKKLSVDEDTGEAFSSAELIEQAQEHYDDILEAMQLNDWTGFGESFEKLGEVIGELS